MPKYLFRIFFFSFCTIHLIISAIAMDDLFVDFSQNGHSYNFNYGDINLNPMFSEDSFQNELARASMPYEMEDYSFELEYPIPNNSPSHSSPIQKPDFPSHLQVFTVPVFQAHPHSVTQPPRAPISQPPYCFSSFPSNSAFGQSYQWQNQSYDANPQQVLNGPVFQGYSHFATQTSETQVSQPAYCFPSFPSTSGFHSSQRENSHSNFSGTTDEYDYQGGSYSTNFPSKIGQPMNGMDQVAPESITFKIPKVSKKRKKTERESEEDFKFIEIVKKRKRITENPKIETNGIMEENKKSEGEDKKKFILTIKNPKKATQKIDPNWKIFQERIPYTLTDGQNNAIRDINADMNSKETMDRVIIAPVGAGKTEVAMHAAFKAIQSGKQVIILCPRCELARQHFVKFKERFEGIAQVVYIPSSYKQSEKNWVYSRIKRGKYNIIIGTHGLLNDNCEYQNLGLTIIDEEQAFGVKQKEFLNNKYAAAHTLILTATPIPRTQKLIESGYYESTVIETLPQGRLQIEVDLSPDISASISKINSEKERGGQTFFVTSKIANISYLQSFLTLNCPNISYKTLHGKMKDNEQAETLQQFREGKFDVLVSTNIIGIGIDIPTANTIIIDDANRFGLGELYQMKGRVGRSEIQGKALLLYNENKITDSSLAKLRAIQKFSGLNDCKKISEIDLELRGGGDVLDTQQHGHTKNQSMQILETYLKGCNP